MEASRAAPPPRPRKSLRLLKRTGDRAFEQLYREHAREVYQYALALLTNPADAEDVTQTAFLNAYRAYQRGERPQKPHNWLIAITHNVCRMRWRQAGCRPSEVALEEAPEPATLDHERPKLDDVLSALAHLTFNQRSALVMRELEGRSYQEIAGVLGLSVSAVEALLFRARRRLRVQRSALGVLGTVPLPGSLTSFLGAGGGAVTAGGTAIGADLVLKAAAVVVAGAVTAGAGYQSVKAFTSPAVPAPAALQVLPAAPGHHRAPARRAQPNRQSVAVGRRTTPRRASPTTQAGGLVQQQPNNPTLATQEATPPPPPPPALIVPTVTPPPVTLPAVLPPPPVEVTPPPILPLPITVTIPVLPPPPIK